MRTEEATRSGASQGSARIVRQDVIYERVCRAILVISIATWKKKLRVDEVVVLAAELEAVLASRPTEGIRDLITILLLECIVPRPHRYTTEKVANGYVRGAGRAGVEGRKGEKRILQAQIVHEVAVNGPHVVQGNLAIVYRLGLVELRLR